MLLLLCSYFGSAFFTSNHDQIDDILDKKPSQLHFHFSRGVKLNQTINRETLCAPHTKLNVWNLEANQSKKPKKSMQRLPNIFNNKFPLWSQLWLIHLQDWLKICLHFERIYAIPWKCLLDSIGSAMCSRSGYLPLKQIGAGCAHNDASIDHLHNQPCRSCWATFWITMLTNGSCVSLNNYYWSLWLR